MNRITKNILTAVFSLLPLIGSAHAGHGAHPADEAAHYFGSPVHIAPIALILALVALVVIMMVRQWRRIKLEEVAVRSRK